MKAIPLILTSVLLVASSACELGPQSGRGLRLPEGDVDRGALAFAEIGCVQCHDIAGDPEPPGGDRPNPIVLLGGKATQVATYGELVTSIINPSHRISQRYPREQVADGEVSKMENLNDRMTVAQLIDLTAFLQSKYERLPESEYVR